MGFVATSGNADALIRSIVRARCRDYDCLVTCTDGCPEETRVLVESLGATVVEAADSTTDVEELTLVLTGAARAYSYPGLLLAPLDCAEIDYARSLDRLGATETFSDEAVVRTGSGSGDAGTVVAIPAYNEESTVGAVVEDAAPYADEVIVVDDGSDDDTAAAAETAGATVVTHDANAGYGAALKTAFREAARREVAHLVVLDADGQHNPADIPDLVERVEEGADVVIGSRFVRDGWSDLSVYRWLGLKTINTLTNASMGAFRSDAKVADTQSGFRVYSRRAIESLAADDSIGDYMTASTDIIYHAHRRDYDVQEVGTSITYAVDDPNSHNPVRHGLSLVSNILKMVEKERPVTVFGVPGFFCTLFGLALGYWSVSMYVTTSVVPIGAALAAAFCTLAGILAGFTALILHSLTIHFENVETADGP